MNKKWYVIRTITSKENKVKSYIESEIARLNFSHIITRVLIPTEKVCQVVKGKKIYKDRNFFPGYVLIEADMTGEVVHIIRNVPDVMGFLGTGKDVSKLPEPIQSHEIERILKKIDEQIDKKEELTRPLIVGETIKVIDGPFSSFSGVVEEVNEEKKKVKVMVKIFGRKTPLELNYMQVEKES